MSHSRTHAHNGIRGSASLGFYLTWRTNIDDVHRPTYPPRFCPCGTKLRRTKPGYARLCDTCEDKAAPRDPHHRERPDKYDTCSCGEQKRVTATRCLACWKQEKHQARQ